MYACTLYTREPIFMLWRRAREPNKVSKLTNFSLLPMYFMIQAEYIHLIWFSLKHNWKMTIINHHCPSRCSQDRRRVEGIVQSRPIRVEIMILILHTFNISSSRHIIVMRTSFVFCFNKKINNNYVMSTFLPSYKYSARLRELGCRGKYFIDI